MKRIFLSLIFLLVFVSCAGCTANKGVQSSAGSSLGVSNSCDKPPEVLEWSGKSYHLKAENTTSEPGMKYGFMKCDQGKYTIGDADNAFTVYSVGNPSTNSDIIFIGNWGRALYAIDAQKANSKEKPAQSITIKQTSSTNLDNWKISISPMLNAAINKWVYDEKVEYVGKSSVQNVEYTMDGSSAKAQHMDPNTNFQTKGNWISPDTKRIDIKMSWDENGQRSYGEATYNVSQN